MVVTGLSGPVPPALKDRSTARDGGRGEDWRLPPAHLGGWTPGLPRGLGCCLSSGPQLLQLGFRQKQQVSASQCTGEKGGFTARSLNRLPSGRCLDLLTSQGDRCSVLLHVLTSLGDQCLVLLHMLTSLGDQCLVLLHMLTLQGDRCLVLFHVLTSQGDWYSVLPHAHLMGDQCSVLLHRLASQGDRYLVLLHVLTSWGDWCSVFPHADLTG